MTAPAFTKKDDSIETIRGLAIILVVAFHIRGDSVLGASDSVYNYFAYSAQYLRMPLFTMISGFLYAMKPIQAGQAQPFLLGKGRRLMLPLLSVSTLEYLATALVPGVSNPAELSEIWRIYVSGYSVFWFLQAIILVFLAISILELLGALNRPERWLGCLGASLILNIFRPSIDFFSLGGFFYLLPFFLLGLGLNRYASWIFQPWLIGVSFVVAISGLAYQQLAWFGYVSIGDGIEGTLLANAVSLTACTLLMRYRVSIPMMARLGFYSYSIYLFQNFGTAIGRQVMPFLPYNDVAWWHFIIVLACGLCVPIVAELILLRSQHLRRIFLGLR